MSVSIDIADSIATVTLARPEVMNALDLPTVVALHEALDEVVAARARVCILTGAGDLAFSAGGDIAAMLESSPAEARTQLEEGIRLTRRLERDPFVSIAAVRGYALGGGTELSLSCALRFASADARFGLPEVTLGIFPGWGGVVRLPRQVPLPIALEMLLSGRVISADEALAAGLVNAIVDDPLQAAQQTARGLLKAGPEAQLLTHAVVAETLDMDLDTALAVATERWMGLMGSAERREGHRAFIERRPAAWIGGV